MCHSALCSHIQPRSVYSAFRVCDPVCVTGRTKEIIPIIYRPPAHSAFTRVRLSGFPALMHPLTSPFKLCLPLSLALWSIAGRTAVLGMGNIRTAISTESLRQYSRTTSFDPSPLVVTLTAYIPGFVREGLNRLCLATSSTEFCFHRSHQMSGIVCVDGSHAQSGYRLRQSIPDSFRFR
jgi:hypothetical protein